MACILNGQHTIVQGQIFGTGQLQLEKTAWNEIAGRTQSCNLLMID